MRKISLISTTEYEVLTNENVYINDEKAYHTLELNGESYQTMEGFGA